MNKIVKLVSMTIVSFAAATAFGASPNSPRTVTSFEIKAAVDAYLNKTVSKGTTGPVIQKVQQTLNRSDFRPLDHRNDDNCNRPRDTQACVDVACAKLGNWGCDEQAEVTQVLRACRGNQDGGCVAAVCTKLGNWGCDEMREIEQVATACQANDGGRCVEVACGKLGNWGCDELSEVTKVTEACAGQYDDAACVQSVCARLGTWGCDEMSEILQVLNECGGH